VPTGQRNTVGGAMSCRRMNRWRGPHSFILLVCFLLTGLAFRDAVHDWAIVGQSGDDAVGDAPSQSRSGRFQGGRCWPHDRIDASPVRRFGFQTLGTGMSHCAHAVYECDSVRTLY